MFLSLVDLFQEIEHVNRWAEDIPGSRVMAKSQTTLFHCGLLVRGPVWWDQHFIFNITPRNVGTCARVIYRKEKGISKLLWYTLPETWYHIVVHLYLRPGTILWYTCTCETWYHIVVHLYLRNNIEKNLI